MANLRNSEDLKDYVFQKDIVEMSNVSKTTIHRRFKDLHDQGYIKEHKGKSKYINSMTCGNFKVFIPTLKGIEYGGLLSKYKIITGGASEKSVLNRFGIKLANLHGKLNIKIPIQKVPKDDGLEWKGPINLRNGVKQYVRHINKAGNEVSIEKFVGPKSQSIILKPRFISNFNDSPEDLINLFIDVAWGIRTDLEMAGYELETPEGPRGEGKFTLKCPAFEDIGYTDSENVIIDYSEGEAELHPSTGDLRGNEIMAKLLLESETVAKKFETEILTNEEYINGLDELGELSKMIANMDKMRDNMEEINRKMEEINRKMEEKDRERMEILKLMLSFIKKSEENNSQVYNPPKKDDRGFLYG